MVVQTQQPRRRLARRVLNHQQAAGGQKARHGAQTGQPGHKAAPIGRVGQHQTERAADREIAHYRQRWIRREEAAARACAALREHGQQTSMPLVCHALGVTLEVDQ